MSWKTAVSWILLAALLLTTSCKISAQERTYAVAQTFLLHREPNGLEGTLQLLMDKRLTQSVRKKLWGIGDWSFVFPSDSKMYKEFSALPPRKAKLRIRDTDGKQVREHELETPLARLGAWNPMRGANQLFLLTEDYSAGVGSYNGPVTTLLTVSDAAFHNVEALNAESRQQEPVRLMKSLKSDWRIKRRDHGGEILSVSCRPKDGEKFGIKYTRYSFDGVQWLEYKREVNGFWESDEPFPERSAFP